MMLDIPFITVALSIISAIGFTSLWLQRQRLIQTRAQLAETKAHLSSGQARFQSLETKMQESLNRQKKLETELKNQEKVATNQRNQLAKQRQAMDSANEAFETSQQSQKRRLAHLDHENAALTEQLVALEAELKQARLIKPTPMDKSTQKQLNKQAEELRELRQQIKVQKNQTEKLRQQAQKTIDPHKVQALLRRTKNLEQICQNLKGLKEMAEERSEQWEYALRILAQHAAPQTQPDAALGPLVTQALETIHAPLPPQDHLMEDHHSTSEAKL